jgi:hypothetical protein
VELERLQLPQEGDLHRADHDVPPSCSLGVEKRIGNPDRHFVPQFGTAEGVPIDDDVDQAGGLY